MTGNDVVERALVLLNYTTPTGEPDPRQNAEQLRKAKDYLNQVLADMLFIQRLPFVQVDSLDDELPMTDDAAIRVAVYGVAMHLAQGENDADSYDRFAFEYNQRRNSLHRPTERVRDTFPYPLG